MTSQDFNPCGHLARVTVNGVCLECHIRRLQQRIKDLEGRVAEHEYLDAEAAILANEVSQQLARVHAERNRLADALDEQHGATDQLHNALGQMTARAMEFERALIELAEVFIGEDVHRLCSMCSKSEWGEEKHDSFCPVAKAYKIVREAKASIAQGNPTRVKVRRMGGTGG